MQVPPPALSVPVDEEVRPRSRTGSLQSSSPRVDSPRQQQLAPPSAPSLSIPTLTFVSPCSSPCASPRSPLTASSPHNEHDEEQLQEQLIEAIYASITPTTGPIGYANVCVDPSPPETLYANVEKAPATSNTATATALPAVAFWSGSERKVDPYVPSSVMLKHGATSPRALRPLYVPPFMPSDVDALEQLPSASLEFGTHPQVGRQPPQRSLQAPVCPMSIRRNAHVMLLRGSRGSQAINQCVTDLDTSPHHHTT